MKNTEVPETGFLSALNAFARAETADGQERSELFRAYCRLLSAIPKEAGEERNRLLRLVFSALLEQLDGAPDGKITEVLYLYTFRDFLESYAGEPVIQQTIRDCLERKTLCKPALQTALRLRIKS